MRLLDLALPIVCIAVKRQRINLKKPPMTSMQYLECLSKQSLPMTVKKLREHINEI
jgi:hypothetical protein